MTAMATTSAPAPPDGRSRELRFRVGEMDCASCLARIESHLSGLEGVSRVHGSVIARTLSVTLDEARVDASDIEREVGRLGYLARPLDQREGAPPPARTWTGAPARRAYVASALVGSALLLRLTLDQSPLPYGLPAADILLTLAALVGGWGFYPKGFAAAKRLSLDMSFLMTAAIFGALLLGELVEAAAIAILFSFAELLEAFSVDRVRASVSSLMKMAPDSAVVVRDGVERMVPAESLVPGDEVILRPGDRVPADGTVVDGASAVDQSPITGESLPVDKTTGDPVFSGTINRQGHLRVRVDRPAGDSALARIVRLVEEAEATKTHSERFVERFARHYTPAVAAAAVVVALAPPLLLGGAWTLWVTRGLTLLVIACPCALVISTPVAIVSGITAAARHGVLIKGGLYLEALGSVRAFALDKTGTLTVGHPTVRQVVPAAGSSEETLARAAAVERRSEHPLARAIVDEARERGLPSPWAVTDFEAVPGEGARALLDGQRHVVGRPGLFPGAPVPAGLDSDGCTVVGVGRNGELLGWIALADRPREGARNAVARLRSLGISPTVMLTGDNHATARAIGAAVGVDEVHAELLPADKLSILRALEAEYGSVAMVGDGVNDGPALAAATVGIAMGAAGSDTALETADVALMGDALERLPYLVGLSRRARRVIQQNIAVAIGIKAVLAVGVPLGYVSLITAVLIGDLGVSLAVTLNALRLARVR